MGDVGAAKLALARKKLSVWRLGTDRSKVQAVVIVKTVPVSCWA